jgi:TonB-linked SusC/RagA family outer membrane protein
MMMITLVTFFAYSIVSIAGVADKTVSGTVKDSNGQPIAGAVVQIKSTSTGVTTGEDGRFSLSVPDNATLTVSLIGYRTKEIVVGTQTTIDIVLEESAELLDELVVVGYGTRVKGALTGSVATTDSKVFETRPVVDAVNALQGAMPGVTVIRGSTRPGYDQISIQVRGYSSMSGAKPLVLLDGIAGDLNLINPNDIENVTVLKDAAASIYGARASDGVILVTTKQGKAGKIQVSYSGNFGVKIPSFLKKMAPTYNMIDMYQESKINMGLPLASDEVVAKIKARSTEVTPGGWLQGYEAFPGHYSDFDHNKEILGNGTEQGHNLSISGGSGNSVYLLSVGFNRDGGIFNYGIDHRSDRFNVALNHNLKNMFNNRLNVDTRIQFDDRRLQEPTYAGTVFDQLPKWWRFLPTYTPEGNYYMWEGFGNLVAMLEEAGNSYRAKDRITINTKAELKIIEGLKFVGQYGVRLSFDETNTENRTFTMHDWNDNIRRSDNNPNSANYSSESGRYSSYTGYLEYTKSLAQKHNINLMVGASHEENDAKSRNITGRNLLSNDIFTINLADKTDIKYLSANTYASDWALNSWFGRLGYNYDMRYLVDFMLRADGSSKFSPSKRWSAVFPAVQVAWNIGNEGFLRNLELFDNLKLRLSWGKSGNQELSFGNYDYIPLININSSVYDFGSPGVNFPGATATIASQERTWETITNYNAGIDFGILQSRLSGSFDVYIKRNSDMLVRQDLPDLLGGSAPTQNIGELETKGFDLSLGWRDKVNDFSYGISFILSDSKNKLLELKGNDTKAEGLVTAREGYSLYSYFGYRSEGIIKTEAQLEEYKKLGGNVPARIGLGDMMYSDIDGDGKITAFGDDGQSGDLVYVGNRLPRYTYSSNIDLSYRNLDLNIFLQGVGKRNVVRTGDFQSPFQARWYPPMEYFYGRTWTAERPDAEFPRILQGSQGWDTERNWDYRYSDAPHRLIDVSYLRIKFITLAYRLPQSWCNAIKMQSIRVYASGQDLFTFSKGTWGGSYDPEEGWQETGNTTYPFTKIISFGIDVKF